MGNLVQRFTQRARRALSLAQAEAENLKHVQVWPAHILLGVMGDDMGVAGQVLARSGASLDQARLLVYQETPPAEKSETPVKHLALSDATKTMLTQSFAIARQNGQHYIAADHLLLALAALDNARTQAVLGQLGLSGEFIRVTVHQIWSQNALAMASGAAPGKSDEPEFLLATLEVCRRLLASEIDPSHLEQLWRIEDILKRYFDLPSLPGTALATGVHFSDSAVTLRLADGREVAAPLAWFPRLKQAMPEQRQEWQPIWDGRVVRWPALEQDIVVRRLLRG